MMENAAGIALLAPLPFGRPSASPSARAAAAAFTPLPSDAAAAVGSERFARFSPGAPAAMASRRAISSSASAAASGSSLSSRVARFSAPPAAGGAGSANMAAPTALKAQHATLRGYIEAEVTPTGYWANMPKFMVSYLKSMYGDAATAENDWGYHWHPKILGDHSHFPMFLAMNDGKVRGMLLIGQNPATSLAARLERAGLRKLQWLAVKDNWLLESATFWKNAPEVRSGEVKQEDIPTEVFFFPSAQVAETEGSFTNTQRLLQWHYKAAEPPGDCRSDLWFAYHLGRLLKERYASSTAERDRGLRALTWDYPTRGARAEPSAEAVLREINGFTVGDREAVPGFAELKADGSTACGCWIYSGCYKDGVNQTARRKSGREQTWVAPEWGWAWPANRRLLYSRASAEENLNGPHHVFIRKGDPHFLLSHAPEIYRLYYAVGTRSYDKTGPRSGVLGTVGAESVTEADCLTIVGWYERAIEMSGGREVRIIHTKCRARGNGHCEYLCGWEF